MAAKGHALCLASGGSAAREACFDDPPAVVGSPSIELAPECLDALAQSDQAAPCPGQSRVAGHPVVVLYAHSETALGLVDADEDANLRGRCVPERVGEALLDHA